MNQHDKLIYKKLVQTTLDVEGDLYKEIIGFRLYINTFLSKIFQNFCIISVFVLLGVLVNLINRWGGDLPTGISHPGVIIFSVLVVVILLLIAVGFLMEKEINTKNLIVRYIFKNYKKKYQNKLMKILKLNEEEIKPLLMAINNISLDEDSKSYGLSFCVKLELLKLLKDEVVFYIKKDVAGIGNRTLLIEKIKKLNTKLYDSEEFFSVGEEGNVLLLLLWGKNNVDHRESFMEIVKKDSLKELRIGLEEMAREIELQNKMKAVDIDKKNRVGNFVRKKI